MYQGAQRENGFGKTSTMSSVESLTINMVYLDMSGTNFAWIVIILGTIVSIFGDTFLGFAAKNGPGYNLKWFILGWIIYGLSAIAWTISYKHEKFAIVGTVYSVVMVLLSLIVGYLVFKEKLSTNQLLGIGLGFISLLLLRT